MGSLYPNSSYTYEIEPNNSKESATNLKLGVPCLAEIGSYEKYKINKSQDTDWFSIELEGDKGYRITIDDYLGDFSGTTLLIYLSNDNNNISLRSEFKNNGENFCDFVTGYAGTYYIHFYNYTDFGGSGDHPYTITIEDYCEIEGHTIESVPAVQATFNADGKTEGSYCSVCGEIIKDQEIINSIKKVSLSKSSYVYDGKTKLLELTVKDSKGNTIPSEYYTVTKPAGRKKVGTYTYKITFKGNYSGTKSLSFKINPKATTVSKVKAGKKSLKVTLKKQSLQTTGYEIQVATDKNFKKNVKKLSVKNNTTSITINNLKGKKKYYVRVRTYKTVNGMKYYSEWKK